MRTDLNGKIDILYRRMERVENERAKTNLGIGELRLSVMKLADFSERVFSLEKEVFNKAS